jgi:Rrf2 family transcriptional regulator, cysteine metabolism repressor
MQLLNKNTDYAVRALIYLAQNKANFCSSRDIARYLKLPLPFVRRILQELRKKDYLNTKEGVGGGVQLIKAANEISIRSIIEIFQGDIQISACMFRKKLCPNRNACVLRDRILKIENKIVAEFEMITVQTLIDDLEEKNAQKNNQY